MERRFPGCAWTYRAEGVTRLPLYMGP
jgi:hypothetical protein